MSASADADQLRLLSIFHYILGGLTALLALFPVIHLVIGIALLGGHLAPDDAESRFVGALFVGVAALFIGCGLVLAGLLLYAGRCLATRRHHLFCTVVAGVSCALMPLGTVLGVFTLVVLLRPSVKASFGARPA
ncbi:hypothetical protein LDO26_13745 [Luteimonas sp. BDR2-5]|uniref:hypothetical protein n=1 Tax=Proluteimonas luteida TaxID=2878685 RepID=UPI001E52E9B1|nr:hypothetical protein [Luteimonas sp. BDR2-5]MCD9029261.1 hypothetical protein [Luteimonas sp. BDR2-5]